jgi:hypothetical protein
MIFKNAVFGGVERAPADEIKIGDVFLVFPAPGTLVIAPLD